uniref:GRIP domain-containing protein n=1 Tax=Hyaloperonospora arabidopsidis (strain Emoy2) TaxID=559515 RepID=M4BZL2_HYAAE
MPTKKKEKKLEQMRELGRGGLTKGLHFLRAAASANAPPASLDGSETTDTSAAAAAVAAESAPSTARNRLTYEELVALSMKLTRQNKLLNAQYQKTQRQAAAAARSDADVETLRQFLEHDVGLDVATCVKAGAAKSNASESSSSGTEGTIDAVVLQEKYRTLVGRKEVAKDRKEIVTSVDLLDLSPVVATAGKLVGEMEDEEMAARGREQVEELKRQAAEREAEQDAVRRELEHEKRRLEQQWHEQSMLVQELTQKLAQGQMRDERREEEAVPLVERERERWRKEMLEQVEAEQKQRDAELQRAADLLAKVEQEKVEMAERLQQAEAAASTLAAKLESDESDEKDKMYAALEAQQDELKATEVAKERLQEQIQLLQQAPHFTEVLEAEVKEKVSIALETQRIELEATKVENTRLQEQFKQLLDAPSSAGVAEAEVEEKVSMAMEAQAVELEATKAENTRLQEQIEASHQTTMALAAEVQRVGAEDVTESLRAEIDSLRGLLETKDNNSKVLEQELVALKNRVQTLQEEAECSSNVADTGLMQELERLKLEVAERAHEKGVLQVNLQVAEERLAKIDSESEATQSLLDALKQDTSRLADQVAQFEQKQAASDEKIVALIEAKREIEKQQQDALEAKATTETQLEEERVYWTSKLENLITASDAADIKNETLHAQLLEKEKEVTKMAVSQASMTSELAELREQVSSMRKDLSSAAENLEAHATKAEADKRRHFQSEKKATELKKRLDEMREKHHESFKMLRQEKEAELERVNSERRAIMKAKKELSRENGKLQTRCNALELDVEVRRKHEEELEAVVRDKTVEVGNLSAELAETNRSLSDRMALATRLQTENMDMASKLAEQVVLIEGALRDAASSKASQREMEVQVRVAQGDVRRMEQSETKAKGDLDRVQRDMVEREESFRAEREVAREELQAAVKNERNTFDRELQRLEAESKHKSKLALQAVLEKEKEITRLSARLRELEEDVRSGGADNRKILEFAQLQAKREAEAREQAAQMQALSEQLEEAHRELQELREGKRRHAEELTAMLQNQRRDGVNMEYLKNVVVQYMSFRPGSSEQARLIPVLSTLLQFTAIDVKEVEHASYRGNSWTSWGSSDTGLDYKPVVVNAGHHYPTACRSSITQGGGERRSPSRREVSASASLGSLASPSHVPSFFLPNSGVDERADPSAESADF